MDFQNRNLPRLVEAAVIQAEVYKLNVEESLVAVLVFSRQTGCRIDEEKAR